mmetsp:Transcript_14709/g.26721  ORF Transcript_14709/g.26721 Transcript_14709/m.26721 type:complete len:556 (-) Transcript_14709:21-1688(-)
MSSKADKETLQKRKLSSSPPPEDEEQKRPKRRRVPPPPGQNITKVRGRRICSHEGCTSFSHNGGVCVRHGAVEKKKKCRVVGCNNGSQVGGICVRHGAKVKKCSAPGCNSAIYNGGVCRKHGAKVKLCSVEGCTNFIVQGGLCKRHGAKVLPYLCKFPGCTRHAQNGGRCCTHGARKPERKKCTFEGCNSISVSHRLCHRHGAPRKVCSAEECMNKAIRGGVCIRHGAKTIKVGKKRGIRKKTPEWEESESEGQQPVPKKRRGRPPKVKKPEWEAKFESEPAEEQPVPRKRRGRLSKADAAVGSTKNNVSGSDVGSGDDNSDDDDDDRIADTNHGGIHRPTREVFKWIRTMSPKKQRKYIHVGMRVKVRFEGNVWYGGMIASVLNQGHKIKISFDDGAKEVSDFPDDDIVVDDQNNGSHHADAQAFIPLQWRSSSNDSEEDESEVTKEDSSGDKVDSSGNVGSMVATSCQDDSANVTSEQDADFICQTCAPAAYNPDSQEIKHDSSDSNDPCDTDEEEELGALIYRSSLTAKSIAEQGDGDRRNVIQPAARGGDQ